MVAVAQLVELQFVVLAVAGSSPVGHPGPSGHNVVGRSWCSLHCRLATAPLAQWQSNGLLIRRFWVRLPGGAPQNTSFGCSTAPTSTTRSSPPSSSSAPLPGCAGANSPAYAAIGSVSTAGNSSSTRRSTTPAGSWSRSRPSPNDAAPSASTTPPPPCSANTSPIWTNERRCSGSPSQRTRSSSASIPHATCPCDHCCARRCGWIMGRPSRLVGLPLDAGVLLERLRCPLRPTPPPSPERVLSFRRPPAAVPRLIGGDALCALRCPRPRRRSAPGPKGLSVGSHRHMATRILQNDTAERDTECNAARSKQREDTLERDSVSWPAPGTAFRHRRSS